MLRCTAALHYDSVRKDVNINDYYCNDINVSFLNIIIIVNIGIF